MAERAPFNVLDPAAAGDAQRRGSDPRELDRCMEQMLSYIYASLPNYPLYLGQQFHAAGAGPDRADRISRLPRDLRRDIVSRLPVKDAARTAVLSWRWRTLWLSTPLVLVDAHLLPKGQDFPPTYSTNSQPITAAVSSILEAHPGPFSCVHLICSRMDSYRPQLARWLQLFAAKGVHDLVLVNRPLPLDLPLPATVFTITTLTRLYLGLWKLPGTAALRGASFPHLRELGLLFVQMEPGDVDYLVARSPVLEILNILGCVKGLRLRLVSQSLRCVQIAASIMENIAVVKAPCLERLILHGSYKRGGGLCTRVRIGDAPKLHAFGYLKPDQVLEIRDTIIMPGIKATTTSMLTSVKILSLTVRFGVRNDVKMLPTLLRCFPKLDRLHIMSKRCDKPTGNLSAKFWEESGPIENVVSRITVMSLREYTGEPGEVGFLEFFFQSARVLKTAIIVTANPIHTPFLKDVAFNKASKSSRNMASKSCKKCFVGSTGPEGGQVLDFKTGAEFSIPDPFCVFEVLTRF
ncbi:F-box/FBD/LRR-repeat protein At1g51370-like [Lolium rigidum]|uniref:F-box/FBD/LRR-repeat protein At1g51370-like n=1 Tax=Lolium rigidum TaxID=89674 RepID=UPI001F5D7FAB|nr:F-box/FBD/LRR-repeat protein At1g51370-like [Lolium rigidum]XP_051213167.1 F-box/FBD/LRR-repeat protein At1g51370-like isoform X1 [Lolium perenne]